ncbi:MAG: YdcF family protein [Bryobacteraceae bacterium]
MAGTTPIKRFVRVALIALLAISAALVVRTAMHIERQATREDARPADVIVILGAAEYRGKPSPVLKARLDHGLELYREKKAPLILTTGGAGGDTMYTEGSVGRDYLVRHGVPSEAILVEMEGDTTMYSTAAAAEIMRRMGLKSCIVVSDGYHIFRAKKMLEAEGIQVYGSPRPTQPQSTLREWWLYTRQAVGYLLWSAGVRI